MFGLEAKAMTAIIACLRQFPQIVWAKIYGSRAKGNYERGSDIEPFRPGVLRADDHRRRLGDERGEHHRQLHGMGRVQVERMDRHVVEPSGGKSGLLPQLTKRCLLGFLALLDAPVHCLPLSAYLRRADTLACLAHR